MKKRNILTLILVLIIILFKIDVNAATCTTTEKSNLKQLARMIEINIVLDSEQNPQHSHSYSITVNNFTDKFYLLDNDGNRYEYKEGDTSDTEYGLYAPGSVVTFTVYGALGKTCAFERLATIRVNFPFYNDYYLSPSCKGIEDFYLCQKTYSGEIETEAWFEEQVKKYKESLIEEKTKVEEPTMIEKINDYVKNNPVIIIVFVISVVLIIIIIVRKIKANKKTIKVNLNLK